MISRTAFQADQQFQFVQSDPGFFDNGYVGLRENDGFGPRVLEHISYFRR